jgi:AcrR family transcriptional regulator
MNCRGIPGPACFRVYRSVEMPGPTSPPVDGGSPTDPPAGNRRSREEIVAANDEAIIDAITAELSDAGWTGCTVGAVSRRSGLTHRAIQPRYERRGLMAASSWERRCAPRLIAALEAVFNASTGHAADLVSAWQAVSGASESARAMGEALVVRQFDADLALAVEATLGSWLRAHIMPPEGQQPAQVHGIRAYLAADALGLLLASRLPSSSGVDLIPHAQDLALALSEPASPAALPPDSAEHMDWLTFTQTPGATTGSHDHDAILDATLALVGNVGFEAATTSRIARMAQVNESRIFALYSTKLDLFMDATLRQWRAGLSFNDAFASAIASAHGAGIAEATLFREAQRPGREKVRALTLEQLRLGWHEPLLGNRFDANLQVYVQSSREHAAGLAEAVIRSRVLGEFAVSQGAVLLAQLVPEAWKMPLDVMCVPMAAVTTVTSS